MSKAIVLPVGLVAIAKEQKIPLWQLEVAMGRIPIECDIATIEEANKAFHQASSKSEERSVVWMTWDSWSFAVAKRTNTIETLADVFNRSPDGGKAEKLALKKMLSLITDESEAKKALELVSDGRKKVVAKPRILEKWERISLKRLSQSKALNEVIAGFQVYANTERVKSAYKSKINQLILEEIYKVYSFERMQNLFELALVYCDEWICVTVANQWILHAKTFEQEIWIFSAAENACIPYESILLDCIKLAKNFGQLSSLYCKINDYQGTQEAMLRKLVILANTIKDLAYVYKAAGSYYAIQFAVVEKIVKLYKKQSAKKSPLVKKVHN